MPTSLGSPLKYEMSRAAKELEESRLLRAPHMLTTTSLDGVFWWPSLGSFDTRTFTTFVAAKTEKMAVSRCWRAAPLWVCVEPKQGCFTTYPCGLCWSNAWLDFSTGQSGPLAPCRCWCLTVPGGWAASSPAPTPHHPEPTPTGREEDRPHQRHRRTKATLGWVTRVA